MAGTLADMLTEIQADTERTKAAEVTAMRSKINAAITHYQKTRFWFNESRSVTFNTVASQAEYTFATIGTEFYKIDGVFVTVSAQDIREMERVDYVDLERLYGSPVTNVPTDYAYINRALRFASLPDAIYSTRITGHIKIGVPVADDTTDNEWFTEAYELIMCHAKALLYAHRWEDPNNASVMQSAAAVAYRQLRNATADKTRTGYLEVTEF